MNHSSQNSGVERGAAQVRHSRPSEGVLQSPPLRDVRKVWFLDIFSLKKSDNKVKAWMPRESNPLDDVIRSMINHINENAYILYYGTVCTLQ